MNVFDGHGGYKLSKYCADNIVDILDKFITKNRKKNEYFQNNDALISDALKFAYKELE